MLPPSLLGSIKKNKASGKSLRAVPDEERRDRSAPDATDDGVLVVDEAASRACFFNSGMKSWYNEIANITFSSTFCTLTREEAKVIVDHWEKQEQWRNQDLGSHDSVVQEEAVQQLSSLTQRLDEAVQNETKKSSVGRAFVKLSTRSPKDSRKVLALAVESYQKKIAAMTLDSSLSSPKEVDSNVKWRMLSEEVAKASSVKSGLEGLNLLLDSYRVYQDLEYALADAAQWDVCLVARAWDPRIRPETEFRGICWNGKLTCLGQYFHPLYFPEMMEQKAGIEHDILDCVASEVVNAAIGNLGGCCIVDFARVAPGEVMIVELNPFDGIALGTFPASTGLFLWDDPEDRKVMTGEAPFQFRIREEPMEEHKLKAGLNTRWRAVIYGQP